MIQYKNFRDYYFAKSRLEKSKKEKLDSDFTNAWYNLHGLYDSITSAHSTLERCKELWTAANKKKLKINLIARGHSSAAVDGLFKCLTEWFKAQKRSW